MHHIEITDEDRMFLQEIADNPGEHNLKLIFAERLAEQGRELEARAMRWMGMEGKMPEPNLPLDVDDIASVGDLPCHWNTYGTPPPGKTVHKIYKMLPTQLPRPFAGVYNRGMIYDSVYGAYLTLWEVACWQDHYLDQWEAEYGIDR